MTNKTNKAVGWRVLGGVILVVLPLLALVAAELLSPDFAAHDFGLYSRIAVALIFTIALYVSWTLCWNIASHKDSTINRMNRWIHVRLGWALLLMIVLFAIGYRGATNDGSEVDQATFVAMRELLSNNISSDEVIYVRVHDADPPDGWLDKLQSAIPTKKLRPWSQRPQDVRAHELQTGEVCLMVCKDDNFLSVNYSEMPLWRVAEVRFGTAASWGGMLLIKIGHDWRVLTYTDLAVS